MKPTLKTLSAGALVLAALETVHAQYAPPPPPLPFQGFINEFFRAKDPYMNQWDFGGNLRLRYESKQGFGMAGVGSAGPPNTLSVDFRDHGGAVNDDYLLSKIRIHAGYTAKWFSAYVEGRSSTAYNDSRYAYPNRPAVAGTVQRKGNGPEADVFDLHQAYVTVGNHKEFPVSLKVGRQEMIYGDERLIGGFGWNNIGRSFDAAKVRWQNAFFGADFFTGFPVVPEDGTFNNNNHDDWFSGVYATSTRIPKNMLDVYFLARNVNRQALALESSPQFPQATARDVYTVGGRLKSQPNQLGNWDYTVEGAYQFGDFALANAGTAAQTRRLDQDAFMFIANVGYTFADWWAAPRLAVEYDFSSGDANSADGTHGTFDNLFPTNHKFYGYMDFISLENIHDLRGIFQLKPTPRMSVAVEGHGFWLADTHDFFYNVGGGPRTTGGYGVHPAYDSFVGTELDVIAGYALTRFAQLEAGYGHFFTGKYIHQSLSSAAVGGDRDADFIYVQTSINF